MPTIHLKSALHPRQKLSPSVKLIQRARLALTAIISTAILSNFAFANEITFQEGYWAGQPIPNDPAFGCHMAMMLDDKLLMSVYANAEGRFDLTFWSEKWNIMQESDVAAQMDIDDQPITFTRSHRINHQVIAIRGTTPADNQRLENLIRKASDFKIAFPKLDFVAHTAFYDNNLAVTALKNCIKTVKRQATQ